MQLHVLVVFHCVLSDGTKTANEIGEKAFEDGYGVPSFKEQIEEWLNSFAKEGEKIETVSLSHSIIPQDENYWIPKPGMR